MKHYYRIFVDESGDHAYGKALESFFKLKLDDTTTLSLPNHDYPLLGDENMRYLALLGVIVKLDEYENNIDPAFQNLKEHHFRAFAKPGPIIMHRKEIINRTGPFVALVAPEREQNFNNHLLSFFKTQEYILIMIVIDKLNHVSRYGDRAYHPYHYCLDALLERYCGILNFNNCKGDVFVESRGKNENKELSNAYNAILKKGTVYRPASFFNSVLAQKLIVQPKNNDVTGLQMSDLLAHPLKKQYLQSKEKTVSELTPFAQELCNIARIKYNHHYYNGRISGYGIVCL